MMVDTIKLNISTPSEPIMPGRGFYQLEEEVLFVQVGPYSSRRKFFSYLESEHICFDIDRSGKLIFIEICVPRRCWQINSHLNHPEIVEPADIRWLNFREKFKEPKLITNLNKTILKLQFKDHNHSLSYFLADLIIAQTNDKNELTALWITDITDDIAGKEISAFRKKTRRKESYFS